MSFTHVGNLGTNSVKPTPVSDDWAYLDITLAGDVDEGQIIVVWFACDNVRDAANPGHQTLYGRMACLDSQDNFYSTLAARSEGAIHANPMGAIFVTRVSRALGAGDTISAKYPALVGGGVAAISAHQFDCDFDLRWAACSDIFVDVTAGSDPASASISGLGSSREHLFLHLLGAEGPDTDAYTWDADYTQITGAGTTGGSDTSNIHVRGSWRIATLTGDTVDVTSDTADRDYIQALVALTEIIYDEEFPLEPVLDDFNRANESPVSRNGDWDTVFSAGPSDASADLGAVVSNQFHAVNGTFGGSFYTDENYQDADGEVYVTIATKGAYPGGASIAFNASGRAENGSLQGIAAIWNLEDPTNGRTAMDCILFGNSDLTGDTSGEYFRAWIPQADGVKFGIQRRYPDAALWVDVGNGWEWAGALHGTSGVQTGFTNGGKFGLSVYDATVRCDDFGGGPLWRPGYYRRL